MASEPSDELTLPHKTLVARSMEELRIKTGMHDGLFRIGKAAWQLDQDTGLITFTSPSGLVATATQPRRASGSRWPMVRSWTMLIVCVPLP